VWGGAVQGAARDVAPKRFSFESTIDALHDAVIGIQAFGIQAQFNPGARAFVFVGAGVEHLKGLPNQLLAGRAEHVTQALVAIHHGPVARQHQAHGREVKGLAVIDHGAGSQGSVLTKNYVV
jgi:hypothetical protein